MKRNSIGEAYERGSRMAYSRMLSECCKGMGYDGTDASRVAWIVEREQAVSALRDVCADHGDNDWPNNLNLADIIAKHLHRNLDRK